MRRLRVGDDIAIFYWHVSKGQEILRCPVISSCAHHFHRTSLIFFLLFFIFLGAYKYADGRKIDGKRVLVDVERGRTVKGRV